MTDDFDDDLRAAIGSRSGGSVDTGTARAAVMARARRVRTLRAAAIGSTAVLLLVAGLLVIPDGRDTAGTPADQPDSPPLTTPTPTTESASAATSTTTEPQITTSTNGPISSTVTPDAPASTAPQATTAPAPVTSPSTAPTAPTVPTTSSAAVVADPPFTRRYDSRGGSITVDWNGSALSLVSVDANAGYESEIEDRSATRIRVRFRGDVDVRIEVRVRDGSVESTVS